MESCAVLELNKAACCYCELLDIFSHRREPLRLFVAYVNSPELISHHVICYDLYCILCIL